MDLSGDLEIYMEMANFAMNMKPLRERPLVVLALLIIGLGSGLIDYFLPAMGDDLVFWQHLGLHDYTAPSRSTVSFIGAHIVGCNGRLFDIFGPVVTNLLPKAIASVLMGAMAMLFYISVLYAARVPRERHTAFALGLIAVTTAVMPWWDSMFLRVCQFNYQWGTTFCLLFIALFFDADKGRERPWRNVLYWMLGALAGASHEQTAVALCGGFGLWLLFGHWRDLTPRRKWMLAGLIVGALLPLCVPALYKRLGEERVGQTPGLLVLTTIPALLALYAVCAVCLARRRSRREILRLAGGEWGMLVLTATIAAAIGIASGIPGRTGFYSEACAIVAFARLALLLRVRVHPLVAGAVSAASLLLLIAHFAVSVATQRVMGREFAEVLAAYQKSADGIVYYDYHGRYDVSPLTLNRVKGVGDADDLWNIYAIQLAYGSPAKKYIVVPTGLRGRIEGMADSVSSAGTTVYRRQPSHAVLTADSLPLQYYPGPRARMLTRTHLRDGSEIWIATPRVRDPGDYALPVISKLEPTEP